MSDQPHSSGVVVQPGASRRHGGASRPRRRSAAWVAACLGWSTVGGGCSISVPINGIGLDPVATGSVPRTDSLLYQSLDQEDGRRARAAMAVALDPQGNGASVTWNNPQSGAKGSFVALAAPYAKDSLLCRSFKAVVSPDPKSDRELDGAACRNTEGDWRVAEVREAGKTRS